MQGSKLTRNTFALFFSSSRSSRERSLSSLLETKPKTQDFEKPDLIEKPISTSRSILILLFSSFNPNNTWTSLSELRNCMVPGRWLPNAALFGGTSVSQIWCWILVYPLSKPVRWRPFFIVSVESSTNFYRQATHRREKSWSYGCSPAAG